MTDALSVALVTAPNVEVASHIGRTLVEERLIACANLVPAIRSIYRWEGAIHDEAEVLLVLKFRRGQFEAVRSRVVALHPYSVPEVLELEIAAAHRPYLDWIVGETAPT